MRQRLQAHVAGKDWWDVAILVSTTDDQLHKAHVKYLEARLVEIAKSIGHVPLDNSTLPARPSLTEAALANMESFLGFLGIVLPAIRVDMFLDKTRAEKPVAETNVQTLPTFVLRTPKHHIEAFAVLENGEIVVQKGSYARAEWAGSVDTKSHYFNLHAELLQSGVLAPEGPRAIFTQNYAFSSPSAAGAVINGRSTNGRTAWVEQSTGATFAEWEAKRLEATLP